jgi:integrase/recombinase XerD
MAKNNRLGKASIWDEAAIKKMRSLLPKNHHRAIFEVGLYTGERIGAIVQLRYSDVYDARGAVLETITYAGATRKSSRHGQAQTRQIFIHRDLKLFLEHYDHPLQGYLFPSPTKCDRHISARAVDKLWRKIFAETGLSGYSTHSSRHWLINRLRSNGIDTSTIADALAIDVGTVRNYLRYDANRTMNAINSITI